MSATEEEKAKTLAHIVLHLEQISVDLQHKRLSKPEALFLLGRLYERARAGPLRESESLPGDFWWDSVNQRITTEPKEESSHIVLLDDHFFDVVENLKAACGWDQALNTKI